METKDKVAVITGASSGIGRQSALVLLKAGYSVVLAGRRAELLDSAIEEAGAPAGKALAVPTDVSDPESIKDLFAKTVETYGRLDLLFNNAGQFSPRDPLEDLTIEQWTTVVNVNLNGVFYCTQEAFKIMKNQTPMGGRIINNGSISAHAPRPNSAPYTATKHAVTGLTKASALDGRKYDIAVCQIDIGNAATERTAARGGNEQPNGQFIEEPKMTALQSGEAVLYMDSLPLWANVQFMTIMATKMPFIGRG
ncbi:MAG: SDR family NAD(P)-dependent oxidoreductase [Chloroflexota bacterium]|nr:SDR family NAD(P)-dependent oxidoreductase [Chloroflexota bacterium]